MHKLIRFTLTEPLICSVRRIAVNVTLLIVISLISFSSVPAQSYFFNKDNSTYRPLQNAQLISKDFDLLDRKVSMKIALGQQFDLRLYDLDIKTDTVTVGSPGYCVFQSGDGNYNIAVDPLVVSVLKYDTTSGIYHGIDTENGKRYYVVEWKNVTLAEYPDKYYNFQLRVEEGSGVIRFHYGPTDIAGGSNGAEILTGIFLLTSNNQLVSFKLVAGDPENPYIDSTSFNSSLTSFPDEGTRFTFSSSTTDVIEVQPQDMNLKVYPNPATSIFEVLMHDLYKMVNVDVINSQGQLVLQSEFYNSRRLHIPIDLTPGIYLVCIKTEESGVHTIKLSVR